MKGEKCGKYLSIRVSPSDLRNTAVSSMCWRIVRDLNTSPHNASGVLRSIHNFWAVEDRLWRLNNLTGR